ncbi:MAG: hypothetical protein MGAcid_13610 [uncultured Acidilobus sp. MG]|jgi:hypothetical protein|nr:MAG: hypothetical protein MGAcid_13610 [uncultured Acidilobus sp. MG]
MLGGASAVALKGKVTGSAFAVNPSDRP